MYALLSKTLVQNEQGTILFYLVLPVLLFQNSRLAQNEQGTIFFYLILPVFPVSKWKTVVFTFSCFFYHLFCFLKVRAMHIKQSPSFSRHQWQCWVKYINERMGGKRGCTLPYLWIITLCVEEPYFCLTKVE